MDIQTILWRYVKGDATAEEKRQVILWLREDDTHIKEYQSLRKLHDLNTWGIKQQMNGKEAKKISLRRLGREFLKIASVLLIGILVTYFFVKEESSMQQMQTIYVPHGQRTELLLSDGTQVWLNSGTTLIFPDHFSHVSRDLKLDGEAYFKVAKDKSKPFVVHTDQYNVRVLGTEFNVKSYSKSNHFETDLLEGSVEVYSESSSPIRIKKNERLFLSDNKLLKGEITDPNYYRWREGVICFEKERLGSLFGKLELYYDMDIVVKKKELLDWEYTGKFRIRDGVEHVLRVLQRRHHFTYTKDDNKNRIVIE